MLHKIRRRPFWVLFFIVLVDLLGFGIVIPILPFLFTDPQSKYSLLGTTYTLQQGYILYGLLIALYPLFQFFGAPILGQLSDRYGRRKLLLITLMGIAFSNTLFAIGLLVKNIPLLFISKILGGLMGGNISIAQAIVADITDPAERSKRFGVLGAGFGIGLVLGPYIGGKLSSATFLPFLGLDSPFWFAAILSILNTISVYIFMPETLKNRLKDHIHWLQAITDIDEAYKYKKFHTIFLVGFLYQASFAFFTSFISVYLFKKFGFDQATIGEFFAYAGVWIAITQLIIIKIIHQKISNTSIVKIGLSLCSLFIFSFFLITLPWELYVLAAFFAIANGLVQTSILGIVSSMTSENSQGRILGINSSMYALAQAIPPLISGFLAASIRSETPIVVSGLTVTLAALIFTQRFHYEPAHD